MKALDPQVTDIEMTQEVVRERLQHFKQSLTIEHETIDEDTESNVLNNQSVLAYQKLNYQGSVELFLLNLDRFIQNPTSYFNFLTLCWEAGVYTDEFLLNEVSKSAVNPYTGR